MFYEVQIARFVIQRILNMVRSLVGVKVAMKCFDILLIVVAKVGHRRRLQRHVADQGIKKARRGR